MKQVNRSYLEEQVKAILNESGVAFSGGHSHMSSTATSADFDAFNAAVYNFVEAALIGARESYVDVATYIKDTGLYGFGDTKYIQKVINEIPLLTKGKNAGINQTAMRFIDLEPFRGADTDKAKLIFKAGISKTLIDMRNLYAPALFEIRFKKFKKTELRRRSRKKRMGSVIRTALIQLDSLAGDHAMKKSGTSLVKMFQDEKMPKVTADLKIYRSLDDTVTKQMPFYIDYFYNFETFEQFNNGFERFIMSQFTYLRNLTYREAYVKMAQSNLPLLLISILAFKFYAANPMKALVGFADIGVSLGSTIAGIYSLGMSTLVTVPAKTIVKKAATTAVKQTIARQIGNASKEGVKSLIKFAGSWKGQVPAFGFIAFDVYESIWRDTISLLQNLQEDTEEYFKEYEEKTPEERLEFYNDDIAPLVSEIKTKQLRGMYAYFEALGMDPKEIQKQVVLIKRNHAFNKTFRQNYVNFNKEAVDKEIVGMFTAISAHTKESVAKIKEAQKLLADLGIEAEKVSNKAGPLQNISKKNARPLIPEFGSATEPQIEKQDDTVSNQDSTASTSDQPLDTSAPEGFDKRPEDFAPAPDQGPPAPESDSEPGEVVVAGDSIAQGLKSAGAESVPNSVKGGQHTWWVLNSLRTNLQDLTKNLDEQKKKKKVLYVSAGVNDALAYAITSGNKRATANGLPKDVGGQPFYTPETTSAEIDQIVQIAKARGYNVKIRLLGPVPFKGRKNSGMGTINPARFNDFCNKVNSHMAAKGYATFPTNVAITADGIHPTGAGYSTLLANIKSGTTSATATVPSQKNIQPKKVSAKTDTGNVLFVGDSIAVGMAAFGGKLGYEEYTDKNGKKKKSYLFAKGVKTAKSGDMAYEIYEKLQKYFRDNPTNESVLREQNEKIMIVSAGTNDCTTYSTNRGGFNAKDVVGYIQKIVDLGKANGYTPRVMPLMAYTGGDTLYGRKIDRSKHEKFINAVNGSNVIKTYGFDSSGMKMTSDGVHLFGSGYRKLFSRAMGGKAYTGAVTRRKAKTGTKPRRVYSSNAEKYYPLIKRESERVGFPTSVAMGVAYAESNFDHSSVSSAGAVGLFQLMAVTGRDTVPVVSPKERYDVEKNVKGALYYIAKKVPRYLKSDMRRLNTKIKWSDLDRTQRMRLVLYGYQQGARAVVTGVQNKRRLHKGLVAFDNINDFFKDVESYYKRITNGKYDYSLKVLNFAEKYGGGFSATAASGTAVVAKSQAAKDKPITNTVDANKTPSDPNKDFEKSIENLKAAEDYGSFVDFFFDIFDISPGKVARINPDLKKVTNELKQGDLTQFRDQRIKFLKDTVHKMNMGKWRKMYKSDIKAAGNDQEKIDNAEKKMAFFHRPMFIVRVFVAKMNLFPGRHISFAFEPNTSRISVDFGGDRVFYGTDFSELDGVTPLQIFLEILARYETAADAVFKKASKLLEEEPERSKDINEYIEFGKSLFNITKGVKTELTSKSTALRKAYATFVLDRAFDLF